MLVLLYAIYKIDKILSILQSFLKTTSFGGIAEVFLNTYKDANSERIQRNKVKTETFNI